MHRIYRSTLGAVVGNEEDQAEPTATQFPDQGKEGTVTCYEFGSNGERGKFAEDLQISGETRTDHVADLMFKLGSRLKRTSHSDTLSGYSRLFISVSQTFAVRTTEYPSYP